MAKKNKMFDNRKKEAMQKADSDTKRKFSSVQSKMCGISAKSLGYLNKGF